jgi:hypothetical protein
MNYTEPMPDCGNTIEPTYGELTSKVKFFYGSLSNLNDIANGLENALEKLTGPEPKGGTCAKDTDTPKGIFSELNELTEKYRAIENRLGTVMERLQQAI